MRPNLLGSTNQPKSGRDSRHVLVSGIGHSVWDESNLSKEGTSIKVFRLCTALALYGMGLYILLNILLMIMMPYIIQLCVSQWKMDIVGLDLGPPPAWLDDPPWDFRKLPPGSDKYANVSLLLFVKNNPWWLSFEVTDIRMFVQDIPFNVELHTNGSTFAGDAKLVFSSRFSMALVNPEAYLCLQHLPAGRSVVLTIAMRSRFKVLGLNSREFVLRTRSLHNGTKSTASQNPAIRGILVDCIEDSVSKRKWDGASLGMRTVDVSEAEQEGDGLKLTELLTAEY